ncbi:MAG: aspartate kinase [Oligoflexia bacterium]|nr:aspartate kinase [Oligoflexia bacterium]
MTNYSININITDEKIVAKFGGTSVGTAEAIIRSAKIVVNNSKIKVVVVSATAGTTNALTELFNLLNTSQTSQAKSKFLEIKERHQKIIEDISKHISIKKKEIQNILSEFEQTYLKYESNLTPDIKDLILSFGERISVAIFASTLQELSTKIKVKHLLATKIICTDENFTEANPISEKISIYVKENLLPLINEDNNENNKTNSVVVTEGFIGSNEKGEITTLGRGGSDYSAALIIRGLYEHDKNFRLLEIWTDVDGIATTDPKIVNNVHNISEVHINEAAELAFLGAKILHPLTLIPLSDVNISVYVGNSFWSDNEKERATKGTFIRKELNSPPLIRALALRNSQTVITLSRVKKPSSYGFLAHVFSILTKYKISIDNITTSEISTSFTYYDNPNIDTNLINELSKYADVKVENSLSLISIIGHKITKVPDILLKIFKILEGYHIRAVFMGASENNISFLISEKHAVEIINKLHSRII